MTRMSALIVDDEESLRRFLSIMLSREGYQVTEVAGGTEALRAFEKDAEGRIESERQTELAGMKASEGYIDRAGQQARPPKLSKSGNEILSTFVKMLSQVDKF